MADNILQPIWQAQPDRWDADMAAHLLRRAGFGGTLEEIDELAQMGSEKAIASVVDFTQHKDDLPPMQFGDLTGPTPLVGGRVAGAGGLGKGGGGDPRARLAIYRDLTPDQRRALFNLDQAAQREKMEEMKLWWLDRMVRTTRPLEEKMTLFWHGLFVSSGVSVKNTYLLYKQNELFRKYALGNYKELALEVSKDPAMLIYLNNNQNVKAHPNENYARELMELFTMGIGNYTEKDIKESARSFTGWTNQQDVFIFNRYAHDDGEKTFLGHTGNFTGEDIVDIIFESPAPPRYIATRLLKFFAIDDPSDDIVLPLADFVRRNKFDIGPVLAMLFSSQWFYSEEVMLRQIKSPVQLVVAALRSLNVGITQPRQVDNALKLMGQELFNAPTVKGWDGGRAWINTSTLFARYNLPAYLGTGRLPTTGKNAGAPDLRTQYADFNSGWDPQSDLAEARVSTTDGVVDLYIRKLLGMKLDGRKRDDLIQFLNGTGDAKSHLQDPIAPDSDHRLRSLVHLVMAMAEYQLC